MCKPPPILSLDAWVKGGAFSTTPGKYLSFNYERIVRARTAVAKSDAHIAKRDFVVPGGALGLISD